MTTITVRNNELYKINLIIGITVVVFALILISTSVYCFLIGLIIAAGVLCKTAGVEIDPEQRRYRNYKSFIGIRWGDWKKIPVGAALVILNKHGTQTTSGGRGAQEISRSAQYSELYLMNSSHLSRFYIHASEEHSEINSLAEKISKLTTISIEKYNPK